MDNQEKEQRGRYLALVAVVLASVVSASVSRGLSGWSGLLPSIVVGAVVGAVGRWLIHRARLRDDREAHGQS